MTALTILIVDDQPMNLKLLRAQLTAAGHAVVEALNGEEGLAQLDRHRVDLVISDILMPVMDGYRFCIEVRRSERHCDLPFIVYTASYVSPSDEKLSLELGADRYLRKPAPAEELLRAVEEVRTGPVRRPTRPLDRSDVLREYSQRLVDKLEKKNIELTQAIAQLQLKNTALETAADAIMVTDANGTIVWVNPAFTRTTGYTPEEAIGQTPRLLRSGLHDEAFYRQFWETIRSGRVWRSEFANRRRDGAIYYDEHTVTPVRGDDGTITHYVGVMHDVTERKLVEQELRKTNAQLRQILEHSPAVLYTLDVRDGQATPQLVSENVHRLLGFEVSETLHAGWWREQLHPDDRPHALESMALTLSKGASRTEYRIRHKSGDYRWVEDSQQLVHDDRGRPCELVGVWTDVTERRRAEEQRQENERRFREMLNNLDLISMMLDPEGRITYCNDHLLRLTGWSREGILGRSWFDTFTPAELVEDMHRVFASLLEDTPESWHHENEILTRRGQRLLVHWNNSVMRSPAGDVIGTASIGEDVTARRDHERQLMRTQRLESLGTLAGGIAHDLNNLLMPILMGATLLKRLEHDPRSEQAIHNIERSVKRGRDLVSQILLFARGGDKSREPVNVGQVVREIESIAGSTFPKNIAIEVSVEPGLGTVNGDPTQLTQVLLNLCVNARDAMPDGGRLSISATSADVDDAFARRHGGSAGGSYAVLEVGDEGEGIAQPVLDRIFDPFFTTKPAGQGTGLGLSTAQGIVASHGGFFRTASTPGEGSRFQVYLPLSPDAVESQREEERAAPAIGGGELILVVDDDGAVLSMTSLALEECGYRVVTAEDGAQAIAVYARSIDDVGLVLTDISMPVLDGTALIAALRRINPRLPVIATTGSPSAGSLSRIRKLGVSRMLTKPYSLDDLLIAVAETLSGPGGKVADS